jgi:phage shock protein PspC (stress-responsive transcriptional regulator)
MESAIPSPDVKKLRRSASDRHLAGVCGGLGDYFGLSPIIYRIAFVALTIAGGTGLLLYAAAALVIPAEGSDESIAAEALREHRDRPWLVIGVALLALAGLFFVSDAHDRFFVRLGGLWFAALVVGALLVWSQIAHRERAAVAPAPRRRSLFWPGFGVLLAAGGLLGLLDAVDAVGVNWTVALAVGVILVGVLVAAAGWWSGAAGLGILGVVLALAMGVALAAHIPVSGGVGDRSVRPVQIADLKQYKLGIGNLSVDLRDLDLTGRETHVRARVGIGHLEIRVPRDVAVSVTGNARAGDVRIFDREDNGTRVHTRFSDPGYATAATRLAIDAKVGLGNIEVRRDGS